MTSDDMQRLTITAPPEAAGERLDRFLAAGLEAPSPLSRTRLKALILDGAVTENGAAVTDPSQSVRAEAEYALLLPPVREATPQAEDIPLDIMFEDDHIIVLNKPSGMVVHPGPGQPDGTLVNALIAHCGDSLTGIGGVMRPGIVHRLDKDTSGVMMAAKSDAAHQKLTEMFAAHDLDRHYLAITWGMPPETEGRIEAALGRSTRDRKKQAVVPNGRYAATNWTVIRRLPPFASIVECRLETGRTHQIRVHMAHRNYPLVGDPLYGGRLKQPAGATEALRQALHKFPRQALHARKLGLIHPATGEYREFEAPLPADMTGLIAALEADIKEEE